MLPTSKDTRTSQRAALVALALGNLVVGTGTLIVPGLLNEMAADLHTSVVAIGLLITGYGLAVCFGAPLLASITSGADRRTVLTIALLLFGMGHLMAALMPNYMTVLIVRVLTGFGAAVFTPQAAATAAILVPGEQRGKAIALVFLGFSVAMVVGLPLGTYLGPVFGWRATFAAVGVLSLVCVIMVRLVLPTDLHVARIGRHEWNELVHRPPLLLAMTVTLAQCAGQFVLFAYIANVLSESSNASPTTVSIFLLWFGVCGIVGNIVAGSLMNRAGAARISQFCILVMLIAFVLWPAGRGSLAITATACALWGLGSFAINSAQQARVVELAPRLASASIALNSASIYFGQALGAALGGAVIASGGIGLLSWVGAAIFCITMVIVILSDSRSPKHADSDT